MPKFLFISLIFFFISIHQGFCQREMLPFPFDWEGIASGEINNSFLLDKPAGEKGFIQIQDGHFVKPNGDRFRIWGVNVTGGACFPEKTEAPKVAEFLSHMGINAVRFHFLDSNWGGEKSIFDYSKNNTREFNPAQLDKLDYFISELKKRGVYSNFNLNVGRNYRQGDKVPYYELLGLAKGATIFDQRIILLQKEYAASLLKHKNAYTGNEYRNEPALAFVEIVNENSLVEAWFSGRLDGDHNSTKTTTWSGIPKYYADELTKKYNAWLNRAVTPMQFEEIKKEAGIIGNTLIPRLKSKEFDKASELRFHSEAKFIMYTENAFYYGMYKYLKESVHVKQLVAANSDHNHYKSGNALLLSTSKLDFVDGHVYWQHPNYFTDSVSGKQTFKIDNTPMVNEPVWSTMAQLSRSAVMGKPYTVSETNHPYPNKYAGEGFVTLGAYASLQDWDGIYFYTLEHDDPKVWKSKRPNYFDILHDPVKMAGIAAGALMFHRADVKEAQNEIIRNYRNAEIVEGIRKNTGIKPFFTPGFDSKTPLTSKTRIQFNSLEENDFPHYENEEEIVSDTGELTWKLKEDRGFIRIDTDKTQALIGFSDKIETSGTQNMSVRIENPFVSLVLTSIDGLSIKESKKMLLTASGSSILSGAKFNENNTSLTEWGELPFCVEPIIGTVILRNLTVGGELNMTALNGAGQAFGETQKYSVNGEKELEIKIGKETSVWYLVERE